MGLSEELKKKGYLRKNNKQRGIGRRAFLANRDEIAQVLEEGYTAKDIWEHLNEQGVMPIQYRTFAQYVRRFITQKEVKETSKKKHEPIRDTDLTPRFRYAPEAKSRDDLI